MSVYTNSTEKNDGWDDYWNYNERSTQIFVVYNFSLEDFLNIKEIPIDLNFNQDNDGNLFINTSDVDFISSAVQNGIKLYERSSSSQKEITYDSKPFSLYEDLSSNELITVDSNTIKILSNYLYDNYHSIYLPVVIAINNFPSYDLVYTLRDLKFRYTIEYINNPKVLDENTYDYYFYTSKTFDLNVPVKAGYTFDGWYQRYDSINNCVQGSKVTTIKSGSKGNFRFFANWKINNYEIKYNLDGGKNNINPTSFTVESDILLSAPEKTGYTFDGWFMDKEYTQKIIEIVNCSNSLTLYAKWSPITYYIQYSGTDINDKLIVSDPIPVKYNESYKLSDTALSNPGMKAIKYTYTINGVPKTISSTATIKNLVSVNTEEPIIFSVAKDSKKNTELWSAATYTITYNLNGGTNAKTNKKSYTITTPKFALDEPTRNGYDFIGWTDEQGNSISSITPSNTSYGDRTITANWNIHLYTIKFITDEGVDPGYIGASKKYTIEEESFTLNNAKWKNHTFVGWYEVKNEKMTSKKITSIKKGTYRDYELMAKFKDGVEYTIAFEGGGAEKGKTTSIIHKAGKKVTMKKNGYIKNGYTFAGWAFPGGDTIAFTDKETIDYALTDIGGSTIVLHAVWELTDYSINYVNAVDGENLCTNNNPKSYTMASEDITLVPAEKTGYDFVGWYFDKSFKKPVTSTAIASGSTGNKTFYAKFIPHNYTISFNANEGIGTVKSISTSVGKATTLSANNFKRTGYTFAGWSTSPEDKVVLYKNKAKVTNLSYIEGSTVTLYAIWTPINYKITYKNIKSTDINNNPLTYTVENGIIILNNPTRSGYAFGGWYLDSKYKNCVTEIDTSNLTAVTLYAKWY